MARIVWRYLAMLAATVVPIQCASIDVPMPQDPTAAIKEAETLLVQQKPEAALVVLKHFDHEEFSGAEQARRTTLLGKAYYMTGDSWGAYKEIKDFARDYPSSPTAEVADVHLKAGLQLLKSNGGFLFFYSDKKRGRQVLGDFLIYYQYSPRVPDVLHELAESAFRDQDYELAKERYAQLIQDHKSSEWVTLARFRVAMCYFYRLEGPPYDLGEMMRARNELRDFLATPTENPKMVQQARDALAQVQEWLGVKHVMIADFYATIHNRYGTLHHLRIAKSDFPDTVGGQIARRRLKQLEEKTR
jgi:outer membrane protein assembly factor BamD (BamD/ComL family)